MRLAVTKFKHVALARVLLVKGRKGKPPPVLAGPQIKQWPTYHNSCIVHRANQIPVAYHGADLLGSLMYSVGVRDVHQERHEAVAELPLQTFGVSLLAYRTARVPTSGPHASRL